MLLVLLVLLVLLSMAWGFRTIALALLAQSAERGNIIPMSFTVARVRLPVGETFALSLPARRIGEPLTAFGTLALSTKRVRLLRRGRVMADVPLSNIAHLTVKGFTLHIETRGGSEALHLRVAQPATIARYIRCLALRGASRNS